MHDLTAGERVMGPEQLLSELNIFVQRGGPAEHEYDFLSALFDKLHGFTKTLSDYNRAGFTRGIHAFNTTETNQGFVCVCPRGYYGDFEIIELV